MTKEKTTSTTSVDRVVHTPGPWVCHFGVLNPYRVFVDDAANNCIACSDSRGGLATTDEIRANGKLISAAPELLKACELFERWMRGGQPGPYSDSMILELVQLAIHKAKS